MSSRSVAALLALGALALACGPHTRPNESAASTTESRPSKEVVSQNGGEQILATTAKVSVNRGVTFTIHVTNISERAVEIDFPSGMTHDFVVVDSVGREVWRWSDGRLFTQALRNKYLGARETLAYEARWEPEQLAGRYTAIARLESSSHPVEERVDFQLP